ncbi:hypothetical protein IM876_09065 [Serratia plymuthica]|uniref:hypothetical protein n=1 Tax=Serratia plymuthica TaxID=82996 RepID=UPI001928D273|nr:hypothetical protein [Serratia plymuthica]MBL3522812.1 hypothetical protein [Serratia plymuthica]
MEREIIVGAVTAIYLIGFFVVFFTSTRNGDEFVEVMLFSIMWPFLVASIPVIAVGLGLSWLHERIKGVSRWQG